MAKKKAVVKKAVKKGLSAETRKSMGIIGGVKHPGGRPTIYSDEMIVQGYMYLETCVDTKKRKDGILHYDVNIPSYEGLALWLGINKDTIHEWRKTHKEFSDLIATLLHKQSAALLKGGLSGNYNPTIAKVLLSKHGYREVTEQEIQQTSVVKFEGIEVIKVEKPDEV